MGNCVLSVPELLIFASSWPRSPGINTLVSVISFAIQDGIETYLEQTRNPLEDTANTIFPSTPQAKEWLTHANWVVGHEACSKTCTGGGQLPTPLGPSAGWRA